MAMADFKIRDEDRDGLPRCQKRVPMRLTRKENRFCLEQTGQDHLPSDSGGRPLVDQYLMRICMKALKDAMKGR